METGVKEPSIGAVSAACCLDEAGRVGHQQLEGRGLRETTKLQLSESGY